MRSLLRISRWLGMLVILGVAAGILAGLGLVSAIHEARAIYTIDTLGSQIESDLRFHAQECRRTFLYALATPHSSEQLLYVEDARQADDRMQEALQRFARLASEGLLRGRAERLTTAWAQYRSVRDVIIATILAGDARGAVEADRQLGKPAFHAVLQELDDTQAILSRHAHEQAGDVGKTLRRCVIFLLLFQVVIGCTFTALLRSNRQRDRKTAELRLSNAQLSAARQHEQRRAAILEKVSRGDPLPDTLQAVARLVTEAIPDAGAALWVASHGRLELQASVNCPEGIAEISFSPGGRSVLDRAGLPATLIRDASKTLTGVLKLYPALRHAVPEAAIAEAAQLASLAIETRTMHDRLAFQAQHDPLTGIPNQTLFQERLEQALLLSRRTGHPAALLWVDLDRFKSINDTYGHRAGDELLIEAAQRLTNSVRDSDTVARIGGDEFAIVAGGLDSVEDAAKIAAKVTAAMSEPLKLAGHDVTVTASCGVSVYPDHGEDTVTLRRNADLAMYAVKHAGRSGYQVYHPDHSTGRGRRLCIEKQLGSALHLNQFHLHYQPIVDPSGNIVSLEALIRWAHPVLHNVLPSEFIPVAEECGLIVAIGEWVLRTACSDGVRWLREGYGFGRLAVNVSPLQLARPDFSARVNSILRDTGFPANRLELEVIETAFMKNLDPVLEQMAILRNREIHFAIDNFGTGHTSLNLLRKLTVDSVKIDRSLIRPLGDGGAECVALVAEAIALAHSLQLQTVAQGVETEAQSGLLGAMGCDFSQGDLYYRPESAARLELIFRGGEARGEAREGPSLVPPARVQRIA